MSATIECPEGHANRVTQRFCGECGLPLVGVCPNGHQNPDGQRYCGECGSSLGLTPPATSALQEASQDPGTPAVADQSKPTSHSQPESGLPPRVAASLGRISALRAKLTESGKSAFSADPSASASGSQPKPPKSGSPGLPTPAVSLPGRIRAWWAKLTKWGKAAVIAALAILLLTVANSQRDMESYDWGYTKGTMGWTKEMASGYSQKEACQSILKLYFDLPGAKGIDRGDAMDGCMDAVKKRPQR